MNRQFSIVNSQSLAQTWPGWIQWRKAGHRASTESGACSNYVAPPDPVPVSGRGGRASINNPSSAVALLRRVDQQGFTLIEAVAILIIIGVLAASAITGFIGFSTISVRAAAEMIQSDIRYAQAKAMAQYAAKSVSFIYGANTYTVDSENKELPSGITIGNTFTVTFDSLGEPTAGGGGSVSISADGQTNTITVTDYTGKVSVS